MAGLRSGGSGSWPAWVEPDLAPDLHRPSGRVLLRRAWRLHCQCGTRFSDPRVITR